MTWIAVHSFPLNEDLRGLSRFLSSRGLQHRILAQPDAQILEVVDAQLVPELQAFITQLSQAQIQQMNDSLVQPGDLDSPGFWQSLRQAPVSAGLIILSCLGALLVQFDQSGQWLRWFSFLDVNYRGFIPLADTLAEGQWWRLVTPAFIHFGLFHVLFNSLWVWELGRRLEFYLGRLEFLLFFVLTAIVANLAEYFWSGISMFGGMSGVVFALVGYLACAQRFDPHPLLAIPRALIGFMLAWLLLCMTGAIDFFISGSIANGAHLGGLLAGLSYALMRQGLVKAGRSS